MNQTEYKTTQWRLQPRVQPRVQPRLPSRRRLLLLGAIVSGIASAVTNNSAVMADDMRDRLQACESCHGRTVESVLPGADQTPPGPVSGSVSGPASGPASGTGTSRQAASVQAAAAQADIYYPSINGKPVEYLYQQLLNFQEGRRINPVMRQMLAYLSPEYLHEIAAWYAQQPAHDTRGTVNGPDLDEARKQRGRLLVQEGDATQPACAACHGGNLAGDGIAIPGLRGLSATYLTAQLGAWREGTRQAREPDCMAEVARSLSGADIDTVARWIAHATDADLTEERVDTAALPRECGAVQ